MIISDTAGNHFCQHYGKKLEETCRKYVTHVENFSKCTGLRLIDWPVDVIFQNQSFVTIYMTNIEWIESEQPYRILAAEIIITTPQKYNAHEADHTLA